MSRHNSGRYYIEAARGHGFEVKPARGDHWKVRGPDKSMMIVPAHRELANGTECAIRKWFLRFGIVLTLAIIAICRLFS
jgi:predicted RNA binding protein YcfA (HicA-like mRNA interferase family)